eukprot:CAMPEP_0198469990 /NCGR_PEP_ID=MMETSP1456-20131121/15510_1 /TAXON_ID=1461544 ORGANISM="Unidentified sp., Strain RCC1871" /NCGR_SAMPLE_ID=MMETSP1456 /ASSEMBLY_ACC=CAM_ASM_001119 /LENGTH=49 /DNA_ID= /DNA_START= /DNA_END= /DNA_ORIENTATION=
MRKLLHAISPPKVPSAAEGENGQYPPPAPTGPYRPDPSKGTPNPPAGSS